MLVLTRWQGRNMAASFPTGSVDPDNSTEEVIATGVVRYRKAISSKQTGVTNPCRKDTL